jgi:hypothetical protein
MSDTTVHAPAALVASSANADDSGHDSGTESTAMAASSSPTHGATKMAEGEIPKLTDLVSFIPEVDVLTVEGSTVLYFESQLAAGLGLSPSKFLCSIKNYLECSLVHLNTNDVSTLSIFIILCECWLRIPLDTGLFWYYYSPARYTKTIFSRIILSL